MTVPVDIEPSGVPTGVPKSLPSCIRPQRQP